MNVIPQYKVIDPYNYDRIIHNIKKNYAKRQDIASQTSGEIKCISDKWRDAFDFEDKMCVIRLSERFQTP